MIHFRVYMREKKRVERERERVVREKKRDVERGREGERESS